MPSVGTILYILAWVFGLYALAIILKYLFTWRAARRAGASIGLGGLIAMRSRKVNPRIVVDAYVAARNAGVDVAIEDIERHHSHGGRVENVIEALRLASPRRLRVTWRDLCRQDLAGQDVVEAIRKRIEAADRTATKPSDEPDT